MEACYSELILSDVTKLVFDYSRLCEFFNSPSFKLSPFKHLNHCMYKALYNTFQMFCFNRVWSFVRLLKWALFHFDVTKLMKWLWDRKFKCDFKKFLATLWFGLGLISSDMKFRMITIILLFLGKCISSLYR